MIVFPEMNDRAKAIVQKHVKEVFSKPIPEDPRNGFRKCHRKNCHNREPIELMLEMQSPCGNKYYYCSKCASEKIFYGKR